MTLYISVCSRRVHTDDMYFAHYYSDAIVQYRLRQSEPSAEPQGKRGVSYAARPLLLTDPPPPCVTVVETTSPLTSDMEPLLLQVQPAMLDNLCRSRQGRARSNRNLLFGECADKSERLCVCECVCVCMPFFGFPPCF